MSSRPARERVYVSHPITHGDPEENIQRAIIVGRRLIGMGFAPMVPGLDAFYPHREDITWADWLAVDLPWVRVSQAILRVPGPSDGADWECRVGRHHSVPVFGGPDNDLEESIRKLCDHYGHAYIAPEAK